MFRSWWATTLFWVIVGSVAFGVAGPSKSFQDCVSERNHAEANQAPQKEVAFFVKAIHWTRLSVTCGFVAADQNTGGITAIAGAIVAFFTFTLWVSTHRLWIAGERQSEIAKTMANAAKVQTALMCRQLDIVAAQKDISRMQYFADHRPRLVLKDVFYSVPGKADTLTFEIANNGGSVAKIVGGFVAMEFVKDQRQFKTMPEGQLGAIDGTTIAEGKIIQFPLEVPSDVRYNFMFPNAGRLRNPDNPLGDLYFFGILSYVDGRGDEGGTTRMSVFRRKWNRDDNTFRRTGNPDHEYAD